MNWKNDYRRYVKVNRGGGNIDKEKILKLYDKLCELYPREAFGSYRRVFNKGLKENIISEEEFADARKYYGSLWNCAGD